MKFDLQKFSEDIKMYRCNKGFSRAEFAKHLGVESQEFIFIFESGKRAPSKEVFENYCKITKHSSAEYWKESDDTLFVDLINKVIPKDRIAFESVLEKISMREYLFALYDREKILSKE